MLALAIVSVSTTAQLAAAISSAQPGDEIVLADGVYPSTGFDCAGNGTASQPIVVRAASRLGAQIEFDALEGFKVEGTNWHFDGLDVRGVCAVDSDCEHAFHVFGAAHGFQLANSRLHDFNAELKVNALNNVWPNEGLVVGNEVFDSRARDTTNPVTKLNIDSGDRWVVRGNFIHDFHKSDGEPTYGAFMKSGGRDGLFDANLVICTKDVAGTNPTIGLSFGGGGTGNQYCEPTFDPNIPCSVEHDSGTMRNNIIANCSDVGIYLNQARNTHLYNNTLIQTYGIDFRFSSTSGEARANALDNDIRMRDGATFSAAENVTLTTAEFEAMYLDPLAGDLRKKGDESALIGKATPLADVTEDYCARMRTGSMHDVGALEHSLGDCATTWPSAAGAGAGAPPAASGGDGGCHVGGASSKPWPLALTLLLFLRRGRPKSSVVILDRSSTGPRASGLGPREDGRFDDGRSESRP
jgi:parallel beta-helix repeat protein